MTAQVEIAALEPGLDCEGGEAVRKKGVDSYPVTAYLNGEPTEYIFTVGILAVPHEGRRACERNNFV